MRTAGPYCSGEERGSTKQKILGISIEPEKEIILTLAYAHVVDGILQEIVKAADLEAPGNGLAFVVSVDKVAGVPHVWNDTGAD